MTTDDLPKDNDALTELFLTAQRPTTEEFNGIYKVKMLTGFPLWWDCKHIANRNGINKLLGVKWGHFHLKYGTIDNLERKRGGEGHTVYFGSRVSESFLRIYDKRAERMDEGEEDPGLWIRVELELKGKKADMTAEMYIREGVPFLVGLLRGLIEFKEPSGDKNKSRWDVAEWWDTFLDESQKRKLSIAPGEPSLQKTKKWLERQVAPSVAFVTIAEGGCVDFLYALVKSGHERLNPVQLETLAAMESRR